MPADNNVFEHFIKHFAKWNTYVKVCPIDFDVHYWAFGTRLKKHGRILGLDKLDWVIRLDLDDWSGFSYIWD